MSLPTVSTHSSTSLTLSFPTSTLRLQLTTCAYCFPQLELKSSSPPHQRLRPTNPHIWIINVKLKFPLSFLWQWYTTSHHYTVIQIHWFHLLTNSVTCALHAKPLLLFRVFLTYNSGWFSVCRSRLSNPEFHLGTWTGCESPPQYSPIDGRTSTHQSAAFGPKFRTFCSSCLLPVCYKAAKSHFVINLDNVSPRVTPLPYELHLLLFSTELLILRTPIFH